MPDFGPTGFPCGGQSSEGGEYHLEACLLAVGGGCAGGLRLPEDGHSLAPWVAITFEGTGSLITVGNDSSPNTDPRNVAIIKSFEFGYSDGLTLRCTIHDEQGGDFVAFMQDLLKDWVCLKNGSPATVRMKVQFGWVKAGCPTPLPSAASRCYYCLSDSVETNFHDGKFVFEITGKDLCHRMFEGGCNQTYGGEGDQAMPLVTAIRQFMTAGCPPNVSNVRFCRLVNNACQPAGFKDGEDDPNGPHPNGIQNNHLLGPKGKWKADGQDKLACVRRWLEKSPSDASPPKGWIPQYNSEVQNGELIFWEDTKPTTPQGDAYWDQNCIGTYIVNGGKRSPVLEFNPKIRWDFARLTSQGGQISSGTANGTGQQGSVQPGQPLPGLNAQAQPCAGQNVSATTTETLRDNNGPRQEVRAAGDGINAAQRALKILTDNIEADLVIVGDPTILPPSQAMWAKNVTIVLIDPYFLRPQGNSLEWLSNPVCNPVLTNKGWICKSVSHRIESGKYTTTIGVFLTTPGVDAPPGSPIGNWSGGWTPTPQC